MHNLMKRIIGMLVLLLTITSGNFSYIRAEEMRIIEAPESQRTKITITPEQYHKSGHDVPLKKRCKQIRYDYVTNTLDFAIITKTPDRFLKHRECHDVYDVLKEFKTLNQESLTQMLDDLGLEITPSIGTLSC